MLRSLTLSSLLILALLTQVGCANLCAKKVPLQDRMTGKDDCVHGFRYYLPRPYLVVSNRVCIGQHVSVGQLGSATAKGIEGKLFIQTLDEAGGNRFFDWQGNEAADPGHLIPVKRVPAEKKAREALSAEPPEVRVQVTGASIEEICEHICPKPKCDVPSPFQFAMLPDFEEQMAIKDCNVAARSRYDLKFADGWQLRSVSGSWDSTEVAVRALQVLGAAVTAAAAVRKEQLDKLPLVERSKGYHGEEDKKAKPGDPVPQLAVRIQSAYIEPGIYRLQKSSERQAGDKAPAAPEAVPEEHFGLMSALGIPVNVETKVLLWKEK